VTGKEAGPGGSELDVDPDPHDGRVGGRARPAGVEEVLEVRLEIQRGSDHEPVRHLDDGLVGPRTRVRLGVGEVPADAGIDPSEAEDVRAAAGNYSREVGAGVEGGVDERPILLGEAETEVDVQLARDRAFLVDLPLEDPVGAAEAGVVMAR